MSEANILIVREARDLAAECLQRSASLTAGDDTEAAWQLTPLVTELIQRISRVLNRIAEEKGGALDAPEYWAISAARNPVRSRVDRIAEVALILKRLEEISTLLAHRVSNIDALVGAAHGALVPVLDWIQAHPELREIGYVDRTQS